jgi:Bacterial alpha-L-rhamnosidase C-terminal domain
MGLSLVSNWRIENGVLRLDATVPPGTIATLYLPSTAPALITENGRPAQQSAGVKVADADNRRARFSS